MLFFVVSAIVEGTRIRNEERFITENVEALAKEEGPSGGLGSMCVTRYLEGNCRYDFCFSCKSWVMCNPVEIKYCQRLKQ